MTDKVKKRRWPFNSLKPGMFMAVLIALAIGFAASFLLQLLSNFMVERVYLSEENRRERLAGYAEDLQDYVTDNELTVEDSKAFSDWARRNKYLYLMIYNGGQLFFESGEEEEEPDENLGEGGTEGENPDGEEPTPGDGLDGTGSTGGAGDTGGDKDDSYGSGITVRFPSKEELVAYAEANAFHDIHTADGGTLMVRMSDFSEYLVYDIGNIFALTVGVLLVFIIIMLYFYRVVSRITRVAADVKMVADGDMEHQVRASGDDEITTLSENVNQMRSSILENIEKERAAMNANAELITAMSHDIRTPLTVLLGYMDIMKSEDVDPAAMKEYVQASEKTVLRLKAMSDDLFNYFLLFGAGAPEVNLLSYDADMLFGQMLSEYILLLNEKGYDVRVTSNLSLGSPEIVTDPDHLMRIIENVFSNIFKYAEKSEPVLINIDHNNEKIQLKFTNNIAKEPTVSESTGIGIRTSKKLAETLGADFRAGESDEVYSVSISFDAVVGGV